MDIVTYAAAKAYANNLANALGAVKGAPCTIKSIVTVDEGQEITFQWTGVDGAVQTETMLIPNGVVDEEARKQIAELSEEIAKLPTTGGGAAVQSDWSVNDETDPAYVKNRTHREEPMYNLEWDGDTTGRFMIPLDIVGATGYVAVHVSHNAYSIEELIGAVIHFTDGYVLYINKSNLITEYPGAIVQRDMAVISVTDSAAITAALGSTVEIPEGMYFMYKPDEGYRATKMVGPLVAYAIPPKYMPELKQAYPQAATCDILLHMFDGEIPEKAFVGDKETVRVKSKFFTTIGKRAFAGCHNIVDVILPNATEIAFRAFEGCGALTTVDLHSIMELGDGAFDSGDALKTFIIRNEDTVAKAGAYVLGMEYTNRGEYYIYVPRALVDSYKAAENWSIYDSRFRALEDYTVDGTITGELDESKI